MKHKSLIVLTTALAISLCGCVNISDRVLPPSETFATQETVETAPQVYTETTEETSAPEETTPAHDVELGDVYGIYDFSESDELFLSDCVFVGDSVCKGLAYYGLIPASRTFAAGGIAARNLFEFEFDVDGDSVKPLIAIANSNKNNIVLWMGMNDLNITDAATYAENYLNIFLHIQTIRPNAQIYAISISPLSSDSEFSTNDKVHEFNAAISDFISTSGYTNWHFVDVTDELSGTDGNLNSLYNGGDGVHMVQAAYYGVLWRLCAERE